MSVARQHGPLAGITIIEIASIGPGPMCGMLLAGLGANVVLVERPGGDANGLPVPRRFDVPLRNRRSLALDLKRPGAAQVVLRLVAKADGLIEGFRPGVAERLGIGPEPCQRANPRLVYGRMTGYGQSGPMAQQAGHDINYIALTGVLHAMGASGLPPSPPLNLVGDYGGGALYLALGMVAGILQAQRSGCGDVIDAAMVDGAASLMALFCGLQAAGQWNGVRGENLLDGGAPFYACYQTACGQYMAVGALEPKFFAILAQTIGLDAQDVARQQDRSHWPVLRAKLVQIFRTRSRDAWSAIFADTDACVTPVLALGEAGAHPHLAARGVWQAVGGVQQPGAAPRFATAGAPALTPPPDIGAQTDEILHALGYAAHEISKMRAEGVVGTIEQVAIAG